MGAKPFKNCLVAEKLHHAYGFRSNDYQIIIRTSSYLQICTKNPALGDSLDIKLIIDPSNLGSIKVFELPEDRIGVEFRGSRSYISQQSYRKYLKGRCGEIPELPPVVSNFEVAESHCVGSWFFLKGKFQDFEVTICHDMPWVFEKFDQENLVVEVKNSDYHLIMTISFLEDESQEGFSNSQGPSSYSGIPPVDRNRYRIDSCRLSSHHFAETQGRIEGDVRKFIKFGFGFSRPIESGNSL